MTYDELEDAYIGLCKTVESNSRHITGLCLTGRTDAAGEASAALAQFARTTRLQHAMKQEQVAGSYDLTALKVDATVPTDSETPERWHDGPLPPSG